MTFNGIGAHLVQQSGHHMLPQSVVTAYSQGQVNGMSQCSGAQSWGAYTANPVYSTPYPPQPTIIGQGSLPPSYHTFPVQGQGNVTPHYTISTQMGHLGGIAIPYTPLKMSLTSQSGGTPTFCGLVSQGPGMLPQVSGTSPVGLGSQVSISNPVGLGTHGSVISPVGLGIQGSIGSPVGLGNQVPVSSPVGLGTKGSIGSPVGLGIQGLVGSPVGLGNQGLVSSSPVGLGNQVQVGGSPVLTPSLVAGGRGTQDIMNQIKHLKYSGDKKWGPFLYKFQTIADYQCWSEGERLFAMSLVLEGTALEYFDLLRKRREGLTFSYLTSRMGERFGQEALRPAANLEFSSMTQKSTESLEQWGDRVMDMAQQALGSSTTHEVMQEQMVLRFALGCFDPEATKHLLNESPKSLEEAIQIVKTLNMSNLATSKRHTRISQVGARPSSSDSSRRERSSEHGKDSYSDDLKSAIIELRDCLKLLQGSANTCNSRSRSPSPIEDRGVGSGKTGDKYSCPVENESSKRVRSKAWQVPLTVNGMEINAIVDSAAEATILSDEVYSRLSPHPKVKGHAVFRMPNDKGMAGSKLEPVTVKIGHYETVFTVYKGAMDDDMLLGIDFLRKCGAIIDCSGTLVLKGQRIPLITSSDASISVTTCRVFPACAEEYRCSSPKVASVGFGRPPEQDIDISEQAADAECTVYSDNQSGAKTSLQFINKTNVAVQGVERIRSPPTQPPVKERPAGSTMPNGQREPIGPNKPTRLNRTSGLQKPNGPHEPTGPDKPTGPDMPTRSKPVNKKGIILYDYKASQFANLQSQDENLRFLKRYLVSKTESSSKDLFWASREAKCYYKEREMFFLDEHGVIWRLPSTRGDPLRLLVPHSEREAMMSLCHINSTVGHQTKKSTSERTRTYFYWWRMTYSIQDFIKTCGVCSFNLTDHPT